MIFLYFIIFMNFGTHLSFVSCLVLMFTVSPKFQLSVLVRYIFGYDLIQSNVKFVNKIENFPVTDEAGNDEKKLCMIFHIIHIFITKNHA